MEVWILLAAAGSGYLARRWQNSQKSKASSDDEAEDGQQASPSCRGTSHRSRYRHFSSSGQRKGGKILCGKDPQWPVRHGAEQKKETRSNDNKKIDRKVPTLDGDRKACESFLGMRSVKSVQGSSRECFSEMDHSELVEGKKLYDVQDLSQRISMIQLGSSSGITGMDTNEGNASAEKPSLELCGSLSVKRANDSDDDKTTKSRYTDNQDGYAGKRIKDTLSSATAQQDDSIFGKTWMPGFWDVSKGVFVLDTESLLVQDEFETRNKGNNSSRKSRTPNKYGKRRTLRKKNLETAKPMSSLESCLSAQLDEYNRKDKKREQFQMALSRGSETVTNKNNIGAASNEENVALSSADQAIGLPSLASVPSTAKLVGNSRIGRISDSNFIERKSTSWKNHPSQSCNKKNTYGRESSFAALVFNFGVGVGMMFTPLSNMEKARRLALILATTESLVKDLDDDLKKKVQQKPDVYLVQNHDARGKLLVEEQSFYSGQLNKLKNVSESLNAMRRILSSDPEAVFLTQPNDLSKLEAELEVELERIELNWDTGDISKTERENSRSSELDGSVGSLVHGELTISGLRHEFKGDSEVEDGSNSSDEDLHARSFAVSPRELARRLHEVLETQQEERISELETEIKHLVRKLQGKEKEIQWLKERSLDSFSGNNESLCFIDEKPYDDAYDRYFKISTGEAISSKEQVLHPHLPFSSDVSAPSSCLPHFTSIDLESSPLSNNDLESNKSTVYTTLQGDALAAYMDACNEFSKVSNDETRSHLTRLESAEKLKDQLIMAGDLTECTFDEIHGNNSEGLEQVDLVSLAEDFYINADPEFMENMPAIPLSARRSRKRNSRKNSAVKHPQPEHLISSSRGFDSSDDTANDTSGSTPCSVKFMDIRTACFGNQTMGTAGEEFDSTRNPPYEEEILNQSGVHTPNHAIYPEIDGRHCDLASDSKQSGWETVNEQDYFSDLDEQLGKLLIKRIVEKSKKGSPIIQDAQYILASFEANDNISD